MTDRSPVTQQVLLTRAGVDQLEHDLRTLREDRRPALAQQLRRATLFMDPTAGAGVAAAARFDLDALDRHIAHLDDLLKRARIVEPTPGSTSVQVGS